MKLHAFGISIYMYDSYNSIFTQGLHSQTTSASVIQSYSLPSNQPEAAVHICNHIYGSDFI